MVGRVITAEPRTKPEPTRSPHALDDQIRAEIACRWTETRPLIRQLKRLRIKLGDPALANHSQRPAAEAKEAELQETIDANIRTIGQQYELLSVDEAKRMAHDGWPGAKACPVGNGLDFAIHLLRDETLGPPYAYRINQE